MGGWVGGQAEYVLVPYADFNLLKLPNREAAMEKIRDLTCLSDILPTGYHGAVTAGVGPGSTVYIAGAGPVGLAAAASARLLGAAVVIVGDVNPTRLAHAKKQGFEIADLSRTPAARTDRRSVGRAGGRLRGRRGRFRGARPRPFGLAAGSPGHRAQLADGHHPGRRQDRHPGLYVTEDPGAVDAAAKHGALSIRFGLGWAKSHSFHTGQTPVMKYNRQLMQAIMWDRIKIADIVGVEVITLDDAPKGYGEFDAGVPKSSSSTRTTCSARPEPPATTDAAYGPRLRWRYPGNCRR